MAENVLEPAWQALEGDGGNFGAREIFNLLLINKYTKHKLTIIWNGLNESRSIFCHFAIRNTLDMN